MRRTVKQLVIAGGVIVTLAGCGVSASNADAPNTGAPNTGAPPASNGQAAQAALSPGAFAPGVSGKVLSVEGNTITVQDMRQQGTLTVTLTESTQVFKRTSIDLASVSVSETVSAIGAQGGDVFTATQVTVGATGGQVVLGGMGQPGGNGQQGGSPQGAPPAGGNAQNGGQPQGGAAQGGQTQPGGAPQAGRGPGGRLIGAVAQVTGDTITVKTADGATVQVRLASNGQITRQVAGTAADITAGAQIIAMGQQSGTTLTATRVEVVAPQ